MEKLRKKERKAFLQKITVYASKKLRYMVEVEEWQYNEISRQTSIPSNRLSEIVNYNNYNHIALNERNLMLLIKGEVIMIKDIKANVNLNKKENDFVDTFIIFENEPLRELVKECSEYGLDPVKILSAELSKVKKS